MNINKHQQRGLGKLSLFVLMFFVVVMIVLVWMIGRYRIPSGAMMPTLLIGDFILVNEFSYGIRLPVVNTKVIEIGEPQRGDVVVFRYPKNPSTPYIKRVIGLPGDQIEYNQANKLLYINGEPVPQHLVDTYIGEGAGSRMTGHKQHIEYLPGAEHAILVNSDIGQKAPFDKWTVPDNEYIVFGDNRDNSRDSRFWGTVPEENLIGKAFFIWMNWDWENGGLNWQRVGTRIY